MFDEKSHSLKMDKAIEVFSKELSSLRTGEQMQQCLISLRLMFTDNKCQLIKLLVLQRLSQE